jgi:hypothetical protein
MIHSTKNAVFSVRSLVYNIKDKAEKLLLDLIFQGGIYAF